EALTDGSAGPKSPGVEAAKVQFDSKMGPIFNTVQKNKLAERNLNMFDMIYINGVSASELYKDKYNDLSKLDRENMIKAEIISGMVNDRAKIDVAPIIIDKDGNEKVTPISLRPSFKEIQPPLRSQFKRFINGLCSPFGKPFKNESEKLAAVIDTPDPEKDARLAAAVRSAQAKVTAEKIAAECAEVNKHLDYLKRQPSPFLQLSSQLVKTQEDDNLQLCRALFGDEVDDTSELSGSEYVDAESDGINIGAAMLFSNGHSFEEILDPNQLKEEKRAAGNQIKEWVAMGNSEDSAKANEAKEGIAGVYQRFAERYSKLDVLDIDHTDPSQLAASQRELKGRGDIANFVTRKTMTYFEDVVKSNVGEQTFEKLTDTLYFDGKMYTTLEESVASVAKALNADDNDKQRSGMHTATVGIHMRGEIGELFNTNKGKTLADTDCEKTRDRLQEFEYRLNMFGLMNSTNGDYEKTALNLCYDRDVTVTDKNISLVRVDFLKGVNLGLLKLAEEPQREAKSLSELDNKQVKVNEGRVQQQISRQAEINTPRAG
ncbi:MAG: hypothetical protein LBS19_02345, partial [Clostridiales bacterium]|nr:hypothetical protein [Clostridiales bacterium]